MPEMGKVIDLFKGKERLSPEQRAYYIQRLADLAIERSLIDAEEAKIRREMGDYDPAS